jgi:hypothetical protein
MVLSLGTEIILDLIKLMYEDEEENCTFLMEFVLTQSKLSFNPKLLDRSYRTNKDTTSFLFLLILAQKKIYLLETSSHGTNTNLKETVQAYMYINENK